ncbi:hypothetical protein [Microcoleus sp. F4-D5]|uniref:hypothetical protein n=1 Tax=Microcoleus sp. F4-D5 TaxID=2818760 RepID=UPI002FCF6AAC
MIPKQSTYRDRLQPWHLIRHPPNCQGLTVARLARRPDAESYLNALPLNVGSPAYNCVRKCGVRVK